MVLLFADDLLITTEDEAVVSELLRSSNGTLELVDAREFLPLFKARAGLTHWHVLDDYHVARKEAVASQREKKEEKQAARASVLAEKKSTAEEDGEVKEMTAIVGEANSSNVANYSNSVGDDNGNADDDNADDAPDGEIGNDVERDGTDAVADDKPQDEMEVLDQAQEERERKVQQSLSLENLPDDPELKACVEMGMNYYRDYEAVPEHLRKKTRLSLFPPTKEELEWMKLGNLKY